MMPDYRSALGQSAIAAAWLLFALVPCGSAVVHPTSNLLCNNGTQYPCVCYGAIDLVLSQAGYETCSDLLADDRLTVTRIHLNLRSLQRSFSTPLPHKEPYESWFRQKVLSAARAFCNHASNSPKLEEKRKDECSKLPEDDGRSVIVVRLIELEDQTSDIDLVVLAANHTRASSPAITDSDTVSPPLIRDALLSKQKEVSGVENLSKLEQLLGAKNIYVIRNLVMDTAGLRVSLWWLALLLLILFLLAVYVVAIIKAIKDNRARKRRGRLAQETQKARDIKQQNPSMSQINTETAKVGTDDYVFETTYQATSETNGGFSLMKPKQSVVSKKSSTSSKPSINSVQPSGEKLIVRSMQDLSDAPAATATADLPKATTMQPMMQTDEILALDTSMHAPDVEAHADVYIAQASSPEPMHTDSTSSNNPRHSLDEIQNLELQNTDDDIVYVRPSPSAPEQVNVSGDKNTSVLTDYNRNDPYSASSAVVPISSSDNSPYQEQPVAIIFPSHSKEGLLRSASSSAPSSEEESEASDYEEDRHLGISTKYKPLSTSEVSLHKE